MTTNNALEQFELKLGGAINNFQFGIIVALTIIGLMIIAIRSSVTERTAGEGVVTMVAQLD